MCTEDQSSGCKMYIIYTSSVWSKLTIRLAPVRIMWVPVVQPRAVNTRGDWHRNNPLPWVYLAWPSAFLQSPFDQCEIPWLLRRNHPSLMIHCDIDQLNQPKAFCPAQWSSWILNIWKFNMTLKKWLTLTGLCF